MKKFLALFLSMVLLNSTFVTISAAEESKPCINIAQDDELQPRIGIAGYASCYHDGNSVAGSFDVSVKSIALPMRQWTVKTSGFPDNATIVADILYNNQQLNQSSVIITGNNEVANAPFVPGSGLPSGTYTVKFDVWANDGSFGSAAGTIEVWVY